MNMFDKYLQMLENAFHAMTSLSRADVTASDYFSVVGYEFAVVFIGILYVAVIVFLIGGPVGISYLIYKKMNILLITAHAEISALQDNYWCFRERYEEKMKILKKAGRKEKEVIYKELLRLLESKNIPYDTSDIKEIEFDIVEKYLPKLPYINFYDDLSKIPKELKAFTSADLSSLGKYKSYYSLERAVNCKKIIFIALWIVTYLAFALPLFFVFIG